MTIEQLIKRTGRALQDNAPAILTALGVGGVLSTAYLTARATHHATVEIMLLESDAAVNDEVVTAKEKVDATWRFYIPPVTMGVVTIGCIIASNVTSSKKQAALYSALSLAQTSFQEYRDKNIALNGEKTHQKVVDSVAEDRVKADPEGAKQVIITGDRQLCYDELSGRYFESSYETIRSAMNDINEKCINHDYASLNEFWAKIGLKPLEMGEELGWNTDNMLQLDMTSMMTEDNRTAIVITFRNSPKIKYYTVWR